MPDPQVERWKQRGRVCLWRYADDCRNFPGWDFSADASGRAAILELLKLMLNARWSSRANIVLARGEFLATLTSGHKGRVVSPESFKLKYPKDRVPVDHWHWEGNWIEPELTLGRAKLTEFIDAIECLARGENDFRIGDEAQPLHGIDKSNVSIWFW